MSTPALPAPQPATLLTIRVSHYCEKARWALDRCGLPYREEGHVPVVHVPFALLAGGRTSMPVLKAPDGVVNDSTDILHYCDRYLPPGQRLFPEEPALRAEVAALEERFDKDVGPHARRATYFYMLPDKPLAVRSLAADLGGLERSLLSTFYAPIVMFMRKGMRIDAAGANRSLNVLTQVILEMDQRLSDGRRYLAGDRFTAADLSFAALMAPVIWPKEYGCPLPDLNDLPRAPREQVLAWRQTRPGQLVLRLYAEERRRR